MVRYVSALAVIFVSLSTLVFAQTRATIVGTATDSSKGVLPGVTVTATEISTGAAQVAVTDERGQYRLAVLPGTYKIQAELTGFASVVLPAVELLVGQNATIPFVLNVASLQETLTVTGETPLVDIRSTQVSGNLDRRQMEELPISGRNWMELTILVKGITANAIEGNKPGVGNDNQFQVNLDGQQISQAVAGSSSFGQPGIGREAIAEYQVVTNLFDVTQGRSAGIQVQAISRSGTNSFDGSVYGYFRSDNFNAADHVAKKVLPYKNQQTGFSLGGPIVRDKTHYFVNWEYEDEPNTFFSTPVGYKATLALPVYRKQYRFLTRGDQQLGAGALSIRYSQYLDDNPFGRALGSSYPTVQSHEGADTYSLQGTWTRVLSANLVQEIKSGFFHYHWNHTPGKGVPLTPNYSFPGNAIGARTNYPEEFWQNTPSIRTDLSWHKGTHDVKVGGEYLNWRDTGWWKNFGRGRYAFSSTPADIERRFPLDAWNDPTRWDTSGLDALALNYQQYFAQEGGQQVGNCPNPAGCGNWSLNIPRKTTAVWMGDTWKMRSNLTLNFGLRYDVDWGATSPPYVTETTVIINNGFDVNKNVGYKNGIRDLGNLQTRAGFTYNVGGGNDLVIRGGTGLYYGTSTSELAFGHQLFTGQRVLVNQVINDKRPGFVGDPLRGVTGADIVSGKVPLPPQALTIIAEGYEAAGVWQSSLGMQKQLGSVFGIDADLLYYRGFDMPQNYDPNVFYDPSNGLNLHPNLGRPERTLSNLGYRFSSGKSDNLHLATGLTRRYKNNWQGGLTYTLVAFRRDTGSGSAGFGGAPDQNFCLSCMFARGADFQRHSLRANGIVRLPFAVSVSGSYIYGSGTYFNANYAQTPTGLGLSRLIPVPGATFGSLKGYDGSMVPRNSFHGQSIHKVDLRFTKDVNLSHGVKVSGIAEVFNLFDRGNFGSYTTQINSTSFGNPVQNLATTYGPRSGQLAFKLSF